MNDCVFCRVNKGELPSYKVYEDDNFLAILDINPLSVGHVQVIPKQHHRWVWDVPANMIGEYFKVVQKVALAQKKAFGNDFVISKVMGDEVEHAHIWVYPGKETPGNKMDFTGNAEKIKNNL